MTLALFGVVMVNLGKPQVSNEWAMDERQDR